VIKPSDLANVASGFQQLHARLAGLQVDPAQILVGMEATLRYGENLLFPQFTQVFADPCRLTATAVLQAYPSARAIGTAGVDAIAAILGATAPRNYGRDTAQRLVDLAEHSVSSELAVEARSLGLKIWCEQLRHTQAHLEQIDEQIEHLLSHDKDAKGLEQVPEFGTQTVAVLRAGA